MNMGLQKLLPRSIRMVFFYVKSKKIAANNQLSREQKIAAIHKKESGWVGDISRMLKGYGFQDTAIVIGMKDMAYIYVSLQSPDDALRYIDAAEPYFPELLKRKSNSEILFHSNFLAAYYKGKAYTQKGMIDKSYMQFDQLNIDLNESIAKDPSNSTLQELYGYINNQIYKDYARIFCHFSDSPLLQFTISDIVEKQLRTFEERDPGNSQIEKLIEYWTLKKFI